MANVTGGSTEQIFNRLAGTDTYHPFDAETFSSWALEAGDVVTVKRGIEEFTAPVHSSTTVWKLAPTMRLTATGNIARGSINKVGQKKYSGRGGAGLRNDMGIHHAIYSEDGYLRTILDITESNLRLDIDDSIRSTRAYIDVTASNIHQEVEGYGSSLRAYIDITASNIHQEVADQGNSLRAYIDVTASNIHQEVADQGNSLRAYIDVTASNIHQEVADQGNSLRTYIDVTASNIHQEVEDQGNSLRAYIDVTASNIHQEVEDQGNSLRAYVDITASNIHQEVEDQGNSLYAYIDVTASNIHQEVVNYASSTRAYIDVTASNIHQEVEDYGSSLRAYIDVTASGIRQDVEDTANSLHSEVVQTASYWRSTLEDTANSLHSEVQQTASYWRSTLDDTANSLHSEIQQTASYWRSTLEDTANSLHSEVQQTASYWRAALEDEANSLRSEVQQTASYWRASLEDTANSLHSEIQQTASYWRAALEDEANSLRSEVQQTASYWRSTLDDTANSLHSEIQQTASYWRSTLEDTANSLHSEVQQTASYWRSTLEDTTNSLHSEIQQTASYWRSTLEDTANSLHSEVVQTASDWHAAIEGVVGSDGRVTAATIAVAINSSGSQAIIDADKVYIGNSKSTTVIAGKCSLSDVSANYIKGQLESVSLLNVNAIAGLTGSAYCYLNEFKGNSYKVNISGGGGSVSTNDLTDGVYDLQITQSGDTYTLKKRNIKSSSWIDVGSFSRATTLSGAWDSGRFTVSASPQNTNKYTDLTTQGHWGYASGEDVNTYYGGVSATIDGGSTSYSTGTWFEVNAYNRYQAGYSQGYTDGSTSGSTTTLTNTWSGGKITVKASPQNEILERTLQAGAPTWSGTTATIPISSVYGNSGQYSEGVVFSPTVNVASKLQSKTFTSSGTRTPDSGYIGFSSVTFSPTYTGEWSGRSYIVRESGSLIKAGTVYNNIVLSGSATASTSSGHYYINQTAIVYADNEGETGSQILSKALSIGVDSIHTTWNNEGATAAGITESWGQSSAANKLTVTRAANTSAKSVTHEITAGVVSVTYNTSTHKYTATGKAYVDGTEKHSSTRASGTEAYDAGGTNAGVTESWGQGSYANRLTVTRAANTDAKSVTHEITAGVPSVSYNTSTHKYTATGKAYIDGTEKASSTRASGTEAYDAGVTAGTSTGATNAGVTESWGTGSAANKLTVTRAANTSAKSVTHEITAGVVSVTYTTSTHKYTATGKAYVDGTEKASSTRASGTEAYDAGVTAGTSAGATAAGVTEAWGTGSAANKLTVTRAANTSAKSVTHEITAGVVSVTYTTSTHKYTATGKAYVDGTEKASSTRASGTEAYDAGVTAGTSAGATAAGVTEAWGTGSAANKLTVTRKVNTDTKSVTHEITAGVVSVTYTTSTHKYTATGKAYVDGTEKASSTKASGTEAYDAGVTDGKAAGATAAGVTGAWGTGDLAHVYTVTKTANTATQSLSCTVTASADISYNSSTHKYTATGKALGNAAVKKTATKASGTEAYDAGVTAGGTAAGVTASWGASSAANKLTISRAANNSTKSLTYTITSSADISYNSSTHKYTATGKALVDGTAKSSSTKAGGTEAYDAGVTDGKSAGNTAAGVTESWGTGSAANKLTVTRKANTDTKSVTHTITAGIATTYNTSTHKYDITYKANVDGTAKDTQTTSTGTEAFTAGGTAAGVTASWGTSSAANKLTVTRAANNGTKSLTYEITAGVPSVTYNSSTHKYTATGKAYVDGTEKSSSTKASGTEAYDAGYTAGCTNLVLDGWGDTYSPTSGVRYTIVAGSGETAQLAMSCWVKATNGYRKEILFYADNGKGAATAVTMAYRNGYAKGKSDAGGGYTHSMSITRSLAGVDTDGNIYYGKLYYINAKTGKYVAASASDRYWYYSGTNKSGTTTVHY